MKRLDNKVAVITGCTSGMGLATAKRFVAEGAYVFIMGRRQRELDAAVKDIGTRVTGVQGDIAKLPDLDRLYDIVKAQKGLELKDRRIRANVISPGTIDTPILAPLPERAIAQIVASIPMGRMGSADEIAKAVLEA